MRGFLTGVLVVVWVAVCLGAIHSARYPHPRILRYNFDVAVRAATDICIATTLALWVWHFFLR